MLHEEYTAEKEHKLYVRNLPYSVTEEHLLHEFESRFKVINVQIARDFNQMSKGTQAIPRALVLVRNSRLFKRHSHAAYIYTPFNTVLISV